MSNPVCNEENIEVGASDSRLASHSADETARMVELDSGKLTQLLSRSVATPVIR